MEIIAELEPTARGPYCGASAGSAPMEAWTAPSHPHHRRAGRRVTFQAGGGIVAVRIPQEYEETLAKALHMREALESAGSAWENPHDPRHR